MNTGLKHIPFPELQNIARDKNSRSLFEQVAPCGNGGWTALTGDVAFSPEIARRIQEMLMFRKQSALVPFVTILLVLSGSAVADSVTGSGSFQSGWTTSSTTFFNNASWDGTNMNAGFCIAGGGNCNFAGQPNSALSVFAGTNFSAPAAFSLTGS